MREFLVRHYELELDVFYVALLAFLVFFLHLFKGVQIGLAIACALVVVGILHSRDADQRPCGADVRGEPVARHKVGSD
jgi:MFS superfamily sulfate permease-like transporter